jgi:hypothetical protein
VPEHDVVRLDVAMDDADAVSRAQCAGDLNADVERVTGIEWSFLIRSRNV